MGVIESPALLRPGPGSAAAARAAERFWLLPSFKSAALSRKALHGAFETLVERTMASSGTTLFDAVEAGVPTRLVDVIAAATGEPAVRVMELIGVSPTTFRRKQEANEALPDVAGHRVMGLLRVVATLRRLLRESGDTRALAGFDLETWVANWLREPQPDLGGRTPAEMLRNPEGQRAVEALLERMRGGLPA
jgi:putative toxin-antitoxin system antitoxin component (TIGR02293 family)